MHTQTIQTIDLDKRQADGGSDVNVVTYSNGDVGPMSSSSVAFITITVTVTTGRGKTKVTTTHDVQYRFKRDEKVWLWTPQNVSRRPESVFAQPNVLFVRWDKLAQQPWFTRFYTPNRSELKQAFVTIGSAVVVTDRKRTHTAELGVVKEIVMPKH